MAIATKPSGLALMLLCVLAQLLRSACGLKFEMPAHTGQEAAKHERCIRNFVSKEQLVMVTATVSGSRGDGQILNMHVGGFL